ncbi:MAG: hypothetical protein F8N15_01705 [Methanobacterium sp.]|nr:hypothetical protein [Methanobacterium sp.]
MNVNLDRKYKFMIPILMVCLSCAFAMGLNTASAANPNQMYVSNTGSDSWSGYSPVWNGTDGPKQTIKNATNAVNNGGTIHISDGVYNENNIAVFSKDVNYIGQSKTKTIVNGNKISRIFSVGAQGVTYNYFFANMSFINGNSTAGGALWNYGATTIDNCIFKNNMAQYSGGAIYSQGTGSAPASLTITNTSFINNTCNMGGAILNALSTVSVSNSEFVNNTGTTSVLYNNYGTISYFQFNRMIGTGTLIHSDSGGDLSLNWWGSNNDPSSMAVGVTVVPWLVLSVFANPTSITQGATSTITADLLHDSGILTDPNNPDLYYHDPVYGHVMDGILVLFSSTLGTVNPVTTTLLNGAATTTFTGNTVGTGTINATIDAQTVSKNVSITQKSPPVLTGTDPVNNSVNIPLNKIVKFTFNKNIKLAANPWIEFKTSKGTIVNFTSSVSGNILSLTPNSLLLSGTKYSVIIHSGSVMDMSNTGTTTPISIVFTTDTAPTVTSVSPANNGVNIPTNKVIKYTFDKSIKLATNPWIEFKTTSGTSINFIASVTGNVLNITPSSLLKNKTKYTIILHTNSVESLGGAGLANPYQNYFTTA